MRGLVPGMSSAEDGRAYILYVASAVSLSTNVQYLVRRAELWLVYVASAAARLQNEAKHSYFNI